jgi:hypothetical protein
LSTAAPRPIKVTDTAPNIQDRIRAVEITNKSSKTGKVTAVIAIMRIFCKKNKNSVALICKKNASALNSKKLALNKTKLKQNHAKSRPT